MKQVLLTGAAGLIGKEAIEPLEKAGFSVYKERVDLFNRDAVEKALVHVKPKYLLHFAWYTGPDYLNAEINYKLRDAGIFLLETFIKNGGKHAAYAGTCFEYKFNARANAELLSEQSELQPLSVYAQAKNELRRKCEEITRESDVSFAWGRIFYVAGHGEHPGRFMPSLIQSLKDNKKFTVTSGPLVRDYLYSKDIAAAFVELLREQISGPVNICRGTGVTMADLATKIAQALGKPDLIEFDNKLEGQPPFIVGDNTRLKTKTGFTPRWNIDNMIGELVK